MNDENAKKCFHELSHQLVMENSKKLHKWDEINREKSSDWIGLNAQQQQFSNMRVAKVYFLFGWFTNMLHLQNRDTLSEWGGKKKVINFRDNALFFAIL